MEKTNILPNHNEGEKALLALIIQQPDWIVKFDMLRPFHFYNEQYGKIFDVILNIIHRGMPIDLLTIKMELKKQKSNLVVNTSDWDDIIYDLSIASPSPNVYFHEHLIVEKYILRQTYHIGGNLQKDSIEQKDPFDIIEQYIHELEELNIIEPNEKTLKTNLNDVIDDIDMRSAGTEIPYIILDYPKAEKMLKLNFNRIILLAGAEKHGKSKFVVDLISRILNNDPLTPIAWESYEMSEYDMIYELICRYSNMSVDTIKSMNHKLNDKERQLIQNSKDILSAYNIKFNCSPLSIDEIYSSFKAFAKKNKHHKPILVIDNLGGIITNGNQTEEEDKIAKKLVQLRDQTKALIFLVHHLKKESGAVGNATTGYRPTRDHIRGSGRFRDFANQILLINCPSRYPDVVIKEKLRRPDLVDKNGVHLIEKLFIVDQAATRHGEPGLMRFIVNLNTNSFKEY